MVGGIRYSRPSAIFLMVPRTILPDRVLGSRFTTVATLKQATGPILSRKGLDQFSDDLTTGTLHTCLSTTRPKGISPLSASAAPTTAHSATSEWEASTSSIAPVD